MDMRSYKGIVGKSVRLIEYPDRGTATVRGKIFQDCGGVILNTPLMGCSYWNIEDIEKV